VIQLAKYVDGYVIVVPKDKTEEYKKMAEGGKEVWMRNGALEYMECIGEGLETKDIGGGKPLAFTELAKAQANETVWFSFVVFESRQHRDEVNAKVMAEMEKQTESYKNVEMPFEVKRMAYGGFEAKVEG
jgi:uncharacterized protein YbaA (DUF1428 family)